MISKRQLIKTFFFRLSINKNGQKMNSDSLDKIFVVPCIKRHKMKDVLYSM